MTVAAGFFMLGKWFEKVSSEKQRKKPFDACLDCLGPLEDLYGEEGENEHYSSENVSQMEKEIREALKGTPFLDEIDAFRQEEDSLR